MNKKKIKIASGQLHLLFLQIQTKRDIEILPIDHTPFHAHQSYRKYSTPTQTFTQRNDFPTILQEDTHICYTMTSLPQQNATETESLKDPFSSPHYSIFTSMTSPYQHTLTLTYYHTPTTSQSFHNLPTSRPSPNMYKNTYTHWKRGSKQSD